jgi:transposase
MLQQRKRYTSEFKEAAIELVRIGKPVTEVAEELGIGSGLIYRWISQNTQSLEPGKEVLQGVEAATGTKELHRLQKEVARLQLENDILKKAAVILGSTLCLPSVK